MTTLGMDPEAVLAIARTLEQQEQRLNQVGSTVERTVAQSRAVWKGPDVDRFGAQWASSRRELAAVAAAIQELVRKARANAAAQITTSNTYDGGSGAGLPGGGGSADGGPWSAHGAFGHNWWGGSTGDHDGTLFGIPVAGGAGYQVGYGGHGSASWENRPDGGFEGKADGGIWGGAQGEAKGSFGDSHLGGSGHVEGLVGAKADGGAELSVDPTTGTGTLDAHGEAFAGARGEGGFEAHGPFGISGSGTGTAEAGAGAEGDVSSQVSPTDLSAHLGGEFFAGAEAKYETGVSAFGFSTHAGVEGIAGVDGGAGAGVAFGEHDIGFDVSGSVADALGLGADFGVHVDPTTVLNEVDGLSKYLPW